MAAGSGEARLALKHYLDAIDNGLKQLFDSKAADPTKARRPLFRGIDRALSQFKAGSTGTATGWYKIKTNVGALTVKVGGDTLEINGAATNHLPADRFKEFLGLMRAEVEAGEFDAELANHGKGGVEVNIPQRTAATISPEAARARGIEAAASRKANREKRGTAG